MNPACVAIDAPLEQATEIVRQALVDPVKRPVVMTFFDEPTSTATHVVHDEATRKAAIIDSLIDYDHAAGRLTYASADRVIEYVRAERLTVEWLMETHIHADHLSAARYLKAALGGKTAIGCAVPKIQEYFGRVFDESSDFIRDGSQFDYLLADGERFSVGDLDVAVLHVPGHTPVDMAVVVGNAVFVGDTIFMPDYGTARADFPGGDARQLYQSIHRLLSLPRETQLFMCHDYKSPTRSEFAWETTVGDERDANVHVHEGVSEDDFVAMRTARDVTLRMPTLILPSLQVNMRAGDLPEPVQNGMRFLKIPINAL